MQVTDDEKEEDVDRTQRTTQPLHVATVPNVRRRQKVVTDREVPPVKRSKGRKYVFTFCLVQIFAT